MSPNSCDQLLNKRTPKVLAGAEQCITQRRMLIDKGGNDECPDNLLTEPYSHLAMPCRSHRENALKNDREQASVKVAKKEVT
jgi:hypothetical protein